jgi:hypothetical protein
MAALIPSASATGSGTMTLAGPSTNSNQTITIPDATGTMMVSGNMPAFSGYLSASQTLSNGVNTVVQINTKTFDTATAFNNTGSTVTLNGLSVLAYSFLPPIAGYYLASGAVSGPGSTVGQLAINLYKNGTAYQQGNAITNATFGANATGSFLVYLNGTTDYIQIYAQQSSGVSAQIYGDSSGVYTYFNIILARSA